LSAWIAKQEQDFPLSPIAKEAFRRSGLPSRTCRHLYKSAQKIFLTHSLEKLDVSDKKSFYDWFNLFIPILQSYDCEFFFSPRVQIGNTDLRSDFDFVWECETDALIRWLKGERVSDLIYSKFVEEKEKTKENQPSLFPTGSVIRKPTNMNRARERVVQFMQRTTQPYSFAFGSLLFFLECVWREEYPEVRGWEFRRKDLDLDWDPYLIHLPLAVKWGVDSLSSLVWRIQRVRFRFAARILGELYPIDTIDEKVRKEFGVKRSKDWWPEYQDDPEIIVDILKTRADAVGVSYTWKILRDVADACLGSDLRF
jgi:hypothetical protein